MYVMFMLLVLQSANVLNTADDISGYFHGSVKAVSVCTEKSYLASAKLMELSDQ